MIDRATVDRIMDAAQIVDVVSDFVTLRKAGVNYKGLCPFHDDRTPSFVVSPSKGLCKCFACGKGGNAVHFIMEHEQLSYPDALRYLARKYNIEIKERELTEEEKQAQDERESMFVVNEWACQFFQDQLYNTVDGRAIGMTYFRSRGFRDDIIKKFQLGYSPSQRDACAREAKAKGYKEEFLLSTGLCYKRDNGQLQDRFFGRVIFPVHTLSGKVVAFGGRVLDAATKGVNVKYQNSPESAIYSKKKELYGLFLAKQAIVRHDLCFLVEGYTDVISMHQMGVENVVSSSGTALTTEQIRMIHRFTENITVLYDGDAAGIKASERGIDMLLAEGMNVKLLLLPDGDDPDSFARKHNSEEFQTFIREHEKDFIRFKTDLLMEDAGKDPIKRAELISNIVRSISVIPEAIIRDVYIKECSQHLRIEEKLLVAEVAKLREAQAEKANRPSYNNTTSTANSSSEASNVSDTPGYPGGSGPYGTGMPPEPVYDDQGNIVSFADPMPAASEGVTGFPPGEVSPSTNTAVSSDSYTSFIPQEGKEGQEFYKFERLILQAVVRYGEKIMCNLTDEEGNEVPVTVIEYVINDLKEDDLAFHNPLHRQILTEAATHIHDAGFIAERYFLAHPDQTISRLSVDLINVRYQLSKYHSKSQKLVTDEERLYELVPMLMINFKYAIVTEELKHMLYALQDPALAHDNEKCNSLMQRYNELREVQSLMAKRLGDRVVLR